MWKEDQQAFRAAHSLCHSSISSGAQPRKKCRSRRLVFQGTSTGLEKLVGPWPRTKERECAEGPKAGSNNIKAVANHECEWAVAHSRAFLHGELSLIEHMHMFVHFADLFL